MDWFTLMKNLKEKSGMTNHDIAEKSGIPEPTLEKVFSGATRKPGINTVIDIIHAMGGTLDSIDPAAKAGQPANVSGLSNAETQLIAKYRALDKRGKETIDIILEREAERIAEIKRIQDSFKTEAAEIIPMPRRLPIPLSFQPVSAGRGAYLGPEEFETIFVDENNLTKRASFAVRVSGDSMEPSYSDGDILLIQGADDIQIGEIGVFTLNGDGYVKERGDGELISLNPEYAPIPMNDSIWCNGHVIGKLAPEWMK